MRTKTITYLIGDGPKEIVIDVTGKKAVLQEGSKVSFELTLSEFLELAGLANDLGRTSIVKQHTQVSSPEPAPAMAPVSANPYTRETSQQAKQSSFLASLEGRDLTTKDMYVVRRNGLFFASASMAGQIAEPSSPIEKARLFPTAEEAHAVAQAWQGCEIVPFDQVGNYRICLAYPDGSVRFWVGNGIEPATHVNASASISGRHAALMTLQTVSPPPGARTFLLPDLA